MSKKDFKFTTNFIVKFVSLRKSLGIDETIKYKSHLSNEQNNNFTGFEESIVTTFDEIFETLDLCETGHPLLDKNGNCRFLYIPDNAMSLELYGSYNKVHITYCNTLISHKKKERYCSTVRSDGVFEIHLKGDELDYVALNVCKNCLSSMGRNNDFSSQKYGRYDKFSFNKFAEDFKDKYPIEFYSYGEKFDKYDYPKNWSKISFDYRKYVGWVCEECGIHCDNNRNNLHVHHINSIRSDCKQSNLKALCRDCHEKEHPHLKRIRQ